MQIGNIGNYYGVLEVKEEEGHFYWGIENWNGTHYQEIPKSLYDELIAFGGDEDD
jgi:hypothetical protein